MMDQDARFMKVHVSVNYGLFAGVVIALYKFLTDSSIIGMYPLQIYSSLLGAVFLAIGIYFDRGVLSELIKKTVASIRQQYPKESV